LACWKKTHAYWIAVRLARRTADEPGASA
jgi:hypothetical protein